MVRTETSKYSRSLTGQRCFFGWLVSQLEEEQQSLMTRRTRIRPTDARTMVALAYLVANSCLGRFDVPRCLYRQQALKSRIVFRWRIQQLSELPELVGI